MPTTMLLRKLEQAMVLSETERQTISELPERVLHVKPREDIVDTSRPTSATPSWETVIVRSRRFWSPATFVIYARS